MTEWLDRVREWLNQRPFRGPDPDEESGLPPPERDAPTDGEDAGSER